MTSEVRQKLCYMSKDFAISCIQFDITVAIKEILEKDNILTEENLKEFEDSIRDTTIRIVSKEWETHG